MDVELTSERDDGSFTWRAAGARQPRGVVEEKLLPAGARVGDVVRVETELGLDGITVVSVVPVKGKAEPEGRIELVPRPSSGGVTTSLVGRSGRPGSGRPRRDGLTWAGGAPEGRLRNGARHPDRAAPVRRGPSELGHQGRAASGSAPGRAAGRVERPERPRRDGSRDFGPLVRAGDEGSRRRTGSPMAARRAGRVDEAGTPPGRPVPRDQPAARAHQDDARPGRRDGRPRTQRLVPGTKHRDALLDSLPAEQRPVAEQLAAGGMPAVRRALEEARAQARAEGRPAVTGEGVIALAEQLQPMVRRALWLDRAEAAVARLDGIALRDLRTTVIGAAPRDEEGRAILQQLRQSLEERTSRLRAGWERDIGQALEAGRVLQALRLSARPPEPTARFPASLVTRLAEAAGSAMTASTPAERWLALLDAAVASPVRRSVKPEGIPEDASGALRKAAQQAAGRVPALARLLGMSMPPPPRPLPSPPSRPVAEVRAEGTACGDEDTTAGGSVGESAPGEPRAEEPASNEAGET